MSIGDFDLSRGRRGEGGIARLELMQSAARSVALA
jgi:hypothetical protein